MKYLAPLIALSTLVVLSSSIKAETRSKQLLDSGCKPRNTEQVCLAVLEHYERAPRGWTLYLRGGRTYPVASQYLPKNQVGKTLEFTVEANATGPEVTDWTTKY